MTTRKELQMWLDQFPEDSTIMVLKPDGSPDFCGSPEVSLDLLESIEPRHNTYADTFTILKHYDGRVEIVLGSEE